MIAEKGPEGFVYFSMNAIHIHDGCILCFKFCMKSSFMQSIFTLH